MPPLVVAAAIGAAGAVGGAAINSETSGNAGNLQAQAAAKALEFQKQQAETDYQNQEVNRKANYQQFAARDARIGTLGEAVGLAPRQTPAYVPSIDPQYVSPQQTAPGGTLAGSPPPSYTGGGQQSQPSTAGAAVQGPSPIGGAPLQASGPMVRLKSPQGQIGSVPQSQVMHYLSLGAQYV